MLSWGDFRGGGGVLRFSNDGEDRRIFLGLKFSIKILQIKYNPFWKILRLRDSAWDFFGFLFFPPFDHPRHLKSAVPHWG